MEKRICKVLVVEDNPEIQELLEYVFEQDGYRFEAVGTAAEMERAMAGPDLFDVAVIDYHLPGASDGVALARTAEAAGLAVVLVSGTGDPQVHDLMQSSGYTYIRKPFHLAALLSAVELALAQAKRDCERRHAG